MTAGRPLPWSGLHVSLSISVTDGLRGKATRSWLDWKNALLSTIVHIVFFHFHNSSYFLSVAALMIGKSSLESVMDSTTLITVIVEPEMFLKTIFHISQRIVCSAYVVITFIARTLKILTKKNCSPLASTYHHHQF